MFVYGFLAPIAVFWAVYRIWPAGRALALSRLLVALRLVQLAAVALIDLPEFLRRNNPDVISGTFGENPYQLVFFLLVSIALLAGIFTFERDRRVARIVPLLSLRSSRDLPRAVPRAARHDGAHACSASASPFPSAGLAGSCSRILARRRARRDAVVRRAGVPAPEVRETIERVQPQPDLLPTQRSKILGDIWSLYGDNAHYAAAAPGRGRTRVAPGRPSPTTRKQTNAAGVFAARLLGGASYRPMSRRSTSSRGGSGGRRVEAVTIAKASWPSPARRGRRSRDAPHRHHLSAPSS